MSGTREYSGMLFESSFSPLKAMADAWIQTEEPPETFRMADVPECARDKFRGLMDGPCIEKVDYVLRKDAFDDVEDTTSRIHIYRWRREAWAVITQQVETQYSPCPCDHSGFQNHGDYFTCSYAGCDERYDRDDLEVDE